MKLEIAKIGLIAIIFILLDFFYLTLSRQYFDNQIKKVQGSKINFKLFPAIFCYISLVFGLYYFIIREKKSLFDAFLLGIVIYSVYELTNLALLNNWLLTTVLLDSIWGGILFTLTTFIIYKVYKQY
jgi:uncharacterized membrane protein